MKKLLLGLLICLCLTSCEKRENHEDYDIKKIKTTYIYNIDFMEIEGHKYILVTSSPGVGSLPVSIIHAESCKCKDKNKDNNDER